MNNLQAKRHSQFVSNRINSLFRLKDRVLFYLSHNYSFQKLLIALQKIRLVALASGLMLAATSCVTSCKVPIENQLVNAAMNDDLARFKKIAAKEVSLDAQQVGMQGFTSLIATCYVSGTNVFCYLLSKRAKVDAPARDGQTALMAAVMLGDANFFKTKALINAGADVNARDDTGTSVLKYALWAGSGTPPRSTTKTISLLEENGAKE